MAGIMSSAIRGRGVIVGSCEGSLVHWISSSVQMERAMRLFAGFGLVCGLALQQELRMDIGHFYIFGYLVEERWMGGFGHDFANDHLGSGRCDGHSIYDP